ncbi:Bug family tripartite tricarboxylate transporter substrate binding protein [Roseomonas xinghualingensis]|uniref:Bug family tripartite tricarboxylate transporter substrate binding protein n=1 Tax=Roseomonas xinghualingensis TaxID=2986475 RepID=UPI0021F0ABB3|nr:tripartite tricarboxylate transporter substrate binding protein [Roseomonas sp. SXEYE001]MCV4208011.1 tripartite tricarboxylate transporter substrate binding protein [Roseomonas sp. SXEYE001]
MNLSRRAALSAPLLASLPGLARAQAAWPARPVRMVVPFTPAGTTDVAARILCERLQARLGQPFTVENRAGAGGNVGSDLVAKAEPDGYTLLMQTISSGAINYSLYGERIPYKPEDLAEVGLLIRVPNVIFVTNSLPVRSLQELVAYAKANPNKLNIGSSGAGTSLHMTGELLKMEAGINMAHVPFRGAGPMMAEVMAGRIEVAVDNLPSAIGHLRDGRFRALAVTTKIRTPALPDCPTTAEAGFPGVEATAWFGVQAPARTPRPIIERLGAEIDAVVKEPATWARLADLGGMKPELTPDGGTSPAAFTAFVRAETRKWGEVVRKSGATVE